VRSRVHARSGRWYYQYLWTCSCFRDKHHPTQLKFIHLFPPRGPSSIVPQSVEPPDPSDTMADGIASEPQLRHGLDSSTASISPSCAASCFSLLGLLPRPFCSVILEKFALAELLRSFTAISTLASQSRTDDSDVESLRRRLSEKHNS
jgi:hypothetical protein